MSESDPLKFEEEFVRKHFDLDLISHFQSINRVEVIRGEDFQYYCFINKHCYTTGISFMYALVAGIELYMRE